MHLSPEESAEGAALERLTSQNDRETDSAAPSALICIFLPGTTALRPRLIIAGRSGLRDSPLAAWLPAVRACETLR